MRESASKTLVPTRCLRYTDTRYQVNEYLNRGNSQPAADCLQSDYPIDAAAVSCCSRGSLIVSAEDAASVS